MKMRVLGVLMAVAVLSSCSGSDDANNGTTSTTSVAAPTASSSTSAAVSAKPFTSGEVVAQFISVDAVTGDAVFKTTCPTATSGEYTLNVKGGQFSDTSDRANPEAGRTVQLTFAEWAAGEWRGRDSVVFKTDGKLNIRSTALPDHSPTC